MRDQIKLTFQIGYPSQDRMYEAALASRASMLCGGCTTHTAHGWWTDDGATHADTFRGELEREHTFQLEVTCEPHKVDRVYTEMQLEIAALSHLLGIDTDWVHVSETRMVGRHFSVAALNAARIAAE